MKSKFSGTVLILWPLCHVIYAPSGGALSDLTSISYLCFLFFPSSVQLCIAHGIGIGILLQSWLCKGMEASWASPNHTLLSALMHVHNLVYHPGWRNCKRILIQIFNIMEAIVKSQQSLPFDLLHNNKGVVCKFKILEKETLLYATCNQMWNSLPHDDMETNGWT